MAAYRRDSAPPRREAGVEWDLTDPDGLQDVRARVAPLHEIGRVPWLPVHEVGGARVFDGSGYLRIPAAAASGLDLAASGDHATVIALVRRDRPQTGFVAGMWQEDDADPRRQYGLFTSLPTYGGDQRVCGHVSWDGRPSPGLPFSRDYSATARRVPLGRWSVVGFTYDGTQIVSYLDGLPDRYPWYVEPGPPTGQGLGYPKNPYRYPHGLNRRTRSDFTVGGVLLSSGMGNMFGGAIARILVTPAAMSAAQVGELSRRWAPGSLAHFEFGSQLPSPAAVESVGWQLAAGTARVVPGSMALEPHADVYFSGVDVLGDVDVNAVATGVEFAREGCALHIRAGRNGGEVTRVTLDGR